MRHLPLRFAVVAAGLAAAAAMLAACGSDKTSTTASDTMPSSAASTTPSTGPAPVINPGDAAQYRPTLDPADFAGKIDNPYMPLTVGSKWHYEGTSDGEPQTVDVVVTPVRKKILGINAFVVRDTVRVNGEVIEDTFDWHAQDRAGNVWYLGEDVKDYENGVVVSTKGSWEAGVDGARPGIVMPAAPKTGDPYRQEYLAGEAEDMMQFTATGASRTVRAGTYDDVVVTRDWSPLEPKVVEEKYYARGTGKILELKIAGERGTSELVSYTPGP